MVKNIRFMLNILSAYAGCPGLSPTILTQFTLEMCVELQKTPKFSIV